MLLKANVLLITQISLLFKSLLLCVSGSVLT